MGVGLDDGSGQPMSEGMTLGYVSGVYKGRGGGFSERILCAPGDIISIWTGVKIYQICLLYKQTTVILQQWGLVCCCCCVDNHCAGSWAHNVWVCVWMFYKSVNLSKHAKKLSLSQNMHLKWHWNAKEWMQWFKKKKDVHLLPLKNTLPKVTKQYIQKHVGFHGKHFKDVLRFFQPTC